MILVLIKLIHEKDKNSILSQPARYLKYYFFFLLTTCICINYSSFSTVYDDLCTYYTRVIFRVMLFLFI